MSSGGSIRFLRRYFRPYLGTALLTLVVTTIYTGSIVIVVALLEPIFGEVLQMTPEDLSARGIGAVVGGGELDSHDPRRYVLAAIERLAGRLGWIGDEKVYFLPLLFAFSISLRSIAGFANGYLFQLVGLGATNDLRNDFFRRILDQSSRFFTRHSSGELASRVGNDIAVMQNAVSTRLLDLFQQSATLVALLIWLLATQFRLAVFCLLLVPAVALPITVFGKGMRRASRRTQERMADLFSLVGEAVRGYRVVKAFGMEASQASRFHQATLRHIKMRLRAQMLTFASTPAVETIAAVGAAAFFIYAGRQIRLGNLTPPEVLTFIALAFMLYDPIRKLNKVNLVVQEALAAAHRVQQVMEEPNDVVERADAIRVDGFEDRLVFDSVSFAYDDAAVLDAIDLEVRRGEVIALVGSSGAGKSTLVNLLPRFYDPDAGSVSLDGDDLRALKLADLRSLIGIVTQDTILFDDTVRRNIAYGRDDLPQARIEAAARAAYAHDFITALPAGYDTEIGEAGTKLSGGERQRLAIARALVKDPPILILDEATSHLDTESERLVQKAIERLMEGRTALVIAHRLSTVQRADRILVMGAGRIVEQGSHESLLDAGGRYRRLYDLQFRDTTEPDAPETGESR